MLLQYPEMPSLINFDDTLHRLQVCLTEASPHDAPSRNSKTRLVVAYTDRIVRLFTWHDSIFTTSATLNAGLASPFEEVHFNLLNNEASAGGGTGHTAMTGDTASNTTSAQGSFPFLRFAFDFIKF